MTFEEFTKKLATIQADEHLTIDTTIDVKRKIVGLKKLWDCSSSELEDIMQEYRKEYIKKSSLISWVRAAKAERGTLMHQRRSGKEPYRNVEPKARSHC